jgi:hypothetical protein
MATLLSQHHEVGHRLAEVPGLGASTPPNRSSRKSARRPRPFPQPSTSPRGWAPAPAKKRARA